MTRRVSKHGDGTPWWHAYLHEWRWVLVVVGSAFGWTAVEFGWRPWLALLVATVLLLPIPVLVPRRALAGSARYRTRTWLRTHLPAVLSDRIPKGARDCGAHEWYRSDATTWHCYNCTPGVRADPD